jgi:hypothetical protein
LATVFPFSNSHTSAEQWRPPPEGVIKFNIDGAFVDGRQQGGWGVVQGHQMGKWWRLALVKKSPSVPVL